MAGEMPFSLRLVMVDEKVPPFYAYSEPLNSLVSPSEINIADHYHKIKTV